MGSRLPAGVAGGVLARALYALALLLSTLILVVASAPTTSTTSNATATAPGRSRNRIPDLQLGVTSSGPRIIGGYDAADGQFPYQVSVRSRAREPAHFCGGSILNATTVVTAAHCLYDVPGTKIGQLYIVAGSNLLSSGGVRVDVVKKLVHPDYGPVYKDYDIALLYLKSPLPLDQQKIAPIALQDMYPSAGVPCVATGWGRTVDAPGAPLSDTLKAVDVPIVDFEQCANNYWEDEDYNPVIESHICAGYEEGTKDACQGDSGGPLVCNGLLTGIVSWGSGCGLPRFPGVYSDVSFLASWIEENVAMDPTPATPSTPRTSVATVASTSYATVVAVALAVLRVASRTA